MLADEICCSLSVFMYRFCTYLSTFFLQHTIFKNGYSALFSIVLTFYTFHTKYRGKNQ